MGLITHTNYTDGNPVTAAGQNANENAIVNEINGQLEDVNIKSSAAIADTKLAQITTASKVAYPSITAVPSFSVNKNGTDQTSVATGTQTLVTWPTEIFDTNSNFASNKFTVTVAGKYFFTACVQLLALGDGKIGFLGLYKNGVPLNYGTYIAQGAAAAAIRAGGSWIVSAVATDYFEIYAEHDKGSDATIEGDAVATYFMGNFISV